MKDKKSRKPKRLIGTKNSILMLVALVSIFFAVWAWFGTAESSDATGVKIAADGGSHLDLALADDGSYPENEDAYSDTIDISNVRSLLEGDVTGDGFRFFIPTTTMNGGVRTVIEEGSWEKAKKNQDYVSVEFYVRSDKRDVFLSSESSLEANLPVLAEGVNKYQVKRVGGFDEDTEAGDAQNAVVGAMRVSIVDLTHEITSSSLATTKQDLELLWIPRPDIYLDSPADKDKPWYVYTNCTENSVTDSGTIIDSYKHKYYYPSVASEADKDEGESVKLMDTYTEKDRPIASVFNEDTGTTSLGQNVKIGDGLKRIDAAGSTGEVGKTTFESGEYYLYKYRMNIWVEGEDAEAKRVLNNGVFSLNVKFSNQ